MPVGTRQSAVQGQDSAGRQTPDLGLLTVERVVIEHIRPAVDGGRFPIKRTVGESVRVVADIFTDGHDEITAALRDRPVSSANSSIDQLDEWRETPMSLVGPGTDEWSAQFSVDDMGGHEYSIVAWVDRFRTWRRDLMLKADDGQDVWVELLEGALLVREAAARADQIGTGRSDSIWLMRQIDLLTHAAPVAQRMETALGGELARLMHVYADRSHATTSPTLRLWVDRKRARFGSWYEMFPRSAGPDPCRSGTFREASALLPAISDLGFDVLYLPPIHPIGRTARKGPNNSAVSRPSDPGSPWAIGSERGGHVAIEPGLGTLTDFDEFRAEAERAGLEIALDLAWQCSPDHPWVREHPEWFRHRPDGTIRYAENPPKKYHDIYPLDFTCEDWRALWNELLTVTRFWIDRGVRIFRVDNPHTKAFGFWEWLIGEVHARDPRVIFLAESFTRPKLMRYIAKLGFTQSYTYFTWRNSKTELTEYFTELTVTDVREYFRPNLFTNTPDILHAYLQDGGRPAFEARLLLAATLGANYGIYSGFELCEGRALPGTEEYDGSEKYQYRKWDWNRPGNIKELVARVNSIRRHHRALQFDWSLRFCATDNQSLIAYTKSTAEPFETLLTIVNLDPHHMQHGFVQVPLDSFPPLGRRADESFIAHDLLDDTTYTWRGEWNYVRFDPGVRQGHILRLGTGTEVRDEG